eukprot:PITA_32099
MLLKLSVADDQLPQIPSGKTAAEIWQQLKDLHETSDKSRAFFLKNQLFSIMMDEHVSLQEHLNKIKDIRDQLEAIGRTMEEEDLVVITLKSLPPSYEHFIETLNITATNIDLKFPDLCTKLMQQDRWKQQFGSGAASASSENAFAAKYQSYQQKGSSQSFDPARKKTVQCNYCHKFGHMKKDCRQRIASKQKKQGGIHQTANVAEHSEQTNSAFYAFMAKRSSDHIPSSAWYIDSGASHHFSHRHDWFIDFSPFSDSVVFGGGEKYTVDGRDDLIITGSSAHLIHEIKQDLCRTFDMTDLGLLHYCLGIEVWQTENNIFLSQSKYAKNLVDRFRMQDCKPATTPMEPGLKLSAQSSSPPVDETLFRQLVGSLIYLTATRPDISFSVSYISRFMSAPKADHWIAAKRVLRYVRGTSDYGLLYTRSSDPILSGYTDSDWAGSVDDRKSTAGYVFNLGSGAVTWTSKKQQAVALSSTEAEYRGAVKASCEAVWLRRMLADMHASQTGPTSLFCDNQGVLKLAKNPVFHEQTKHVETHCHYIRQLVEDGFVRLKYVPTTKQPADIFTKPLGPAKFEQFRRSIGVVNRLSIKGGY